VRDYKWPRVWEDKANSIEDFFEKVANIHRTLMKKHNEKTGEEKRLFCNSFIFRGQGNATWPLRPSLLRDNNFKIFDNLRKISGVSSRNVHAIANHSITMFCKESDDNEFKIPDYNNKFKNESFKRNLNTNYLSIGSSDAHRMALAQHYELPTLFLDWTENPLIACYFAASQALDLIVDNNIDNPKHIAIWILNIDKNSYTENIIPFDIHNVPRAGNTNLVAQKGLFTYWNALHSENNEPPFWGMEDRELDCHVSWILPMLIKITLDIENVKELLNKLSKINIKASTIFPGYYGAAKSVIEEAKIRFDYYANKKK